MAIQLQVRRGTAAQNNAFTGASAEITVNTDNNSIRVHDGVTAGGTELARSNQIDSLLVKSVAGGVDVTLSAGEAANSNHEYTGILTGNINVIVPAVSHNFTAENLTTGAFTLTVKTAAGTGILIPQGKALQLYCNGTKVEDSNSAKANLTGAIFTGAVNTTGTTLSTAAPTASTHAMNMNAAQRQTGIYFGTSGTLTAYTCTATGVTAYSDGLTLDIQPHVTCGDAATINVNALGAQAIYRELVSGTLVTVAAGEMVQYVNQRITYSTTQGGFIIRGSKARRTAVISATRDMTAADGAVAYTGLTFKPSKITALSSISATRIKSNGIGSSAGMVCQFSGTTAGYDGVTSTVMVQQLSSTGGAAQRMVLTSLDSGGFTGTWTKTATPAAETATLRFFCEE